MNLNNVMHSNEICDFAKIANMGTLIHAQPSQCLKV